MSDSGALITHYKDIEPSEFGAEAPGVSIRVLIDDERDGAPVYILRMIEIAPGGNTPDHSHPYEHENFVIEGKGEVMVEGEWSAIGKGSVVFVPPSVRHQYRNTGGDPLRFLCGIPAKRLQGAGRFKAADEG